MRKIKLTLSRAHKIVERLNQEVQESQIRLEQNLFADVRLPLSSEDSVRQQLDAMEAVVKSELERIQSLMGVSETIRKLVGTANIKAGVHEKLTEKETLDRKLRLVTSLIEKTMPGGAKDYRGACLDQLVRLENHISSQIRTDTTGAVPQAMLRGGQRVTSVNANTAQSFVETRDLLKRQLRKISDDLNDANQKTIEVEMDDNLAETLGL